MAQQKFGSYLHVTGTDQLKREMATAVAKHGLSVRFTEDRMNHWLNIDQKRPPAWLFPGAIGNRSSRIL